MTLAPFVSEALLPLVSLYLSCPLYGPPVPGGVGAHCLAGWHSWIICGAGAWVVERFVCRGGNVPDNQSTTRATRSDSGGFSAPSQLAGHKVFNGGAIGFCSRCYLPAKLTLNAQANGHCGGNGPAAGRPYDGPFHRQAPKSTKTLQATQHYADKDLPSISVLIPARNETEELHACLDALVASDYPKLEILVLDDCSQERQPQKLSAATPTKAFALWPERRRMNHG